MVPLKELGSPGTPSLLFDVSCSIFRCGSLEMSELVVQLYDAQNESGGCLLTSLPERKKPIRSRGWDDNIKTERHKKRLQTWGDNSLGY
jgi:hypothetical protein